MDVRSRERRDTGEKSDSELVRETLRGNTEAFGVLHRRYYQRVFRLAYYRTRSQTDAEDIAAETFVRAIAHLGSYRAQGDSVFPWLARIASNLVTDLARKQGGMAAVSLDATTAESIRSLIEGLPSDAPDPHALAERQETQALVRNAILSLPREQSEAVLMRYLGDLSLRDIALNMGKTEGAIKSLLHRALMNLRRALTEGEQAAARFGAVRSETTQRGQAAAQQTEMTAHQRWSNLEIDDGDD